MTTPPDLAKPLSRAHKLLLDVWDAPDFEVAMRLIEAAFGAEREAVLREAINTVDRLVGNEHRSYPSSEWTAYVRSRRDAVKKLQALAAIPEDRIAELECQKEKAVTDDGVLEEKILDAIVAQDKLSDAELAHEILCVMRAAATPAQTREINKFRLTLQTIVDCFDARAELFTSDADMARNFVDRARLALGVPARVESVVAGITRADTGQQSFVSTTVDNVPTEVRFSNPPINMILHCPSCHKQHVDAPDGDWTNPPHKSHLCHHCSTVWRPADVATNGVAYIQSAGTRDTWICAARGDPMAGDLGSNPDTGHFFSRCLLERPHGAASRNKRTGVGGGADALIHDDGLLLARRTN